uniref:THAP-type domain-containing protein n=1 Tax=Magallana gigas TaxID=29159 RepID=K1QTL4_MAGGI
MHRYPEKLMGAKFIPFPKPKSDLEKCLRWISCCRRPHAQLNVDKITKHTYVCSKHFISLDGPSDEYPDPCDAQTGELHRARRKIIYLSQQSESDDLNSKTSSTSTDDSPDSHAMECCLTTQTTSNPVIDSSCQTEEECMSRYSDYIYQSTERPFCVPTLCELGDVFCVRPRTIHCMRKASRHEFIEEHETISGNIADFTWFETG